MTKWQRLGFSLSLSLFLHLAALLLIGDRHEGVSPLQPLPSLLVDIQAARLSEAQPPEAAGNSGEIDALPTIPFAEDGTSAISHGIALSVSSDVSYWPVGKLSRKPYPLRDWDGMAWQLPPQARGRLVMTLYISASGMVDKVEFLTPSVSELQDWVNDNLLTGKAFSPGEIDGKPVGSKLTIELDLSQVLN